jgi:hypothetical protein
MRRLTVVVVYSLLVTVSLCCNGASAKPVDVPSSGRRRLLGDDTTTTTTYFQDASTPNLAEKVGAIHIATEQRDAHQREKGGREGD